MKVSKLLGALSIFAVAQNALRDIGAKADFAQNFTLCNEYPRETSAALCIQGDYHREGECDAIAFPGECVDFNISDCTRDKYERRICGVSVENPSPPSGLLNGIYSYINGLVKVGQTNFQTYLGCLWQNQPTGFFAQPSSNFTCVPPNNSVRSPDDQMEQEQRRLSP